MSFGFAPLNGTSVLYNRLDFGLVCIMKENYEVFIPTSDTFNKLYHVLSESKAALKSDCIEYAVFSRNKELYQYPNWYVRAVVNGYIYEDGNGNGYGFWMFHEDSGEIAMSEGSYILRNFQGDLMYMEPYEFKRHYEIIEEGTTDGC